MDPIISCGDFSIFGSTGLEIPLEKVLGLTRAAS